jgi:hypothetical protein
MLLHVWSAARLNPQATRYAIGWVLVGFVGRWALIGLGLTLALQRGPVAGLLMFLGIMTLRWYLIYKVHHGKAFGRWL